MQSSLYNLCWWRPNGPLYFPSYIIRYASCNKRPVLGNCLSSTQGYTISRDERSFYSIKCRYPSAYLRTKTLASIPVMNCNKALSSHSPDLDAPVGWELMERTCSKGSIERGLLQVIQLFASRQIVGIHIAGMHIRNGTRRCLSYKRKATAEGPFYNVCRGFTDAFV